MSTTDDINNKKIVKIKPYMLPNSVVYRTKLAKNRIRKNIAKRKKNYEIADLLADFAERIKNGEINIRMTQNVKRKIVSIMKKERTPKADVGWIQVYDSLMNVSVYPESIVEAFMCKDVYKNTNLQQWNEEMSWKEIHKMTNDDKAIPMFISLVLRRKFDTSKYYLNHRQMAELESVKEYIINNSVPTHHFQFECPSCLNMYHYFAKPDTFLACGQCLNAFCHSCMNKHQKCPVNCPGIVTTVTELPKGFNELIF